MSIKKAILDKSQGSTVEKSEYTNLIMDDMPINDISDEDKTFLEGFTECQFLSLNSTNLKDISNLPKMPKLERLELCDNGIEFGCDVIATQYPELKVLKLTSNHISSLEEIRHLAQCETLESLDIQNNPVIAKMHQDISASDPSETTNDESKGAGKIDESIRKKIREMLPKLEVINGFNKDGQEIMSDEDEEDEEEDDEEGSDEEGMDEGIEGADDMQGEGESDENEAEDAEGEGEGEDGPEREENEEDEMEGMDDEAEDEQAEGESDEEDMEPSAKRQKLVSGGANEDEQRVSDAMQEKPDQTATVA